MFTTLKHIASGLGHIIPTSKIVRRGPATCLQRKLSLVAPPYNETEPESEFSRNRKKIAAVRDDGPDTLPYSIPPEIREELVKGDPKRERELESIMMSCYYKKQTGEMLPEKLSVYSLSELMQSSLRARGKLLNFLIYKDYQKKKDAIEKAEKREIYEKHLAERLSNEEFEWLSYHCFGNTYYDRIFKKKLIQVMNSHMAKSLMFGQNVVLDCSYNNYMNQYEMKQTAKQILSCVTLNRTNQRPFALTLSSYDTHNSHLHELLNLLHPDFETLPLNITSKSFSEVFPREKIVYLTPHSSQDLEYDPDDIYIIGAFVDKADNSEPISASKAMKAKVRKARLPLDRFVKWKRGTKNLCLNQVLGMILDVKNTGMLGEAIRRNVPSRKTEVIN